MMKSMFTFVLLMGFLFCSFMAGCNSTVSHKGQAAIASKVGDSCTMEHMCKILVKRYENPNGNPPIAYGEAGANVYYRCLVNETFYEIVSVGEPVMIDTGGKNCEKVNP